MSRTYPPLCVSLLDWLIGWLVGFLVDFVVGGSCVHYKNHCWFETVKRSDHTAQVQESRTDVAQVPTNATQGDQKHKRSVYMLFRILYAFLHLSPSFFEYWGAFSVCLCLLVWHWQVTWTTVCTCAHPFFLPVSSAIRLIGCEVQFFQRGLSLCPSVCIPACVNILHQRVIFWQGVIFNSFLC